MINFDEDIYSIIINKIYTPGICKLDCDFHTLKNMSFTNKFLNKLICEFISEKVIKCNIISFNNKKFCKFHNLLEYKICKYLNILRKNKKNESNLIENNLKLANILTHSYHLDDKDVTDSNKIKLKNFFEEITIGTEFYFNHQCCNGRGIMFDTIEK